MHNAKENNVMENNKPKTCFVIMPFGEKPNIDGEVINFDHVYEYIIKKSIESLDITCIRCDEIGEAGSIHEDMFQHIFEDDVAVVDLTSLNANVLYELGVRHALRDSVTVLIQKKGTPIPFNIQGFRIIEYELDLPGIDKAQKDIAEFVRGGLDKPENNDSVVHKVLPDLKVMRGESKPKRTAKRLTKQEIFEYKFKKTPHRRIALITGDIRDVEVADIWVNSENRNMQMARYYDRSISGIIRYLGAKKDEFTGHVVDDTIANELAEIMRNYREVPAGQVIPTGSGELAETHNVKRIFHAASVAGQIGSGYSPISNIDACITNALKKADDLRDEELKSILFPLMGTGTGKGSLKENAQRLIQAAISYLDANPDSSIDIVYFITSSDIKLETCQAILDEADEIEA
jgi:O-acetyl-ADP-ribose deacetylase (regulator of RNase III)